MEVLQRALKHGYSKADVLHAYDDALRLPEVMNMSSNIHANDLNGPDSLDPATTPARDATHFRNIRAARAQVVRAQAALDKAVAEARAAGDSWTIIGAALETTRQAAYQRFGRD